MRRLMAGVGAAVMVLAIGAAPVFAGGSCPPPPVCPSGGIDITLSVNALGGHQIVVDVPAGASRVTICHFGQEHDGDFAVPGSFE